jgi:pentatricopeptide repeat protein
VLEHYGDVCAKLGEMAKARDYWEKAIEKGGKFDLNAKLSQGPK